MIGIITYRYKYSVIRYFILLPALSIIYLYSCKSTSNKLEDNLISSNIINIEGITSLLDTLTPPEKIKASEPIKRRVGKLEERPEPLFIYPAQSPDKIDIKSPRINYTDGKYFENPQVNEIKPVKIYCKAPDVAPVKEPHIQDINPMNFSSYSILQGLRHNQIRSMIQDKLGNIWLATDDGLTKYDGKNFYHYTTEQGLNNNLILSVFEDSKGNIWFGSFRGGASMYDGKYLYIYTKNEGLSDDVVNWITEDKSGAIWIATGNGLSKIKDNKITVYSEKNGLSHKDTRAVIEDKDGKIWIATYGGGLNILNGEEFLIYSKDEGFVDNYLSFLYKDRSETIWIGMSNDGVVKYNNNQFTRFSTKQGLINNHIRTIMEDNQGSMWFGAIDSGATKFNGKHFEHFKLSQGLASNYIRSSMTDRNGNIWLGTRGAGLTRFDGNRFNHYTVREGLSNSRIMSIIQDSKGTFWFGTYGGYATKGVIKKENNVERKYFSQFGLKEGLLGSRVYTVSEDSKGNIWFGTDGGGISVYDGTYTCTYTTAHGLPDNSIRDIIEDRTGRIWIATYGSGFSLFDGEYFTNYSVKNGLPTNNILDIFEDDKGVVWLGTDGGGVIAVEDNKMTIFNEESGFFSNTVYNIGQDSDGTLWMGTGGAGLVKFKNGLFEAFNTKNGLNNNHVLSLEVDKEGNIWAGTRFGINILENSRKNLVKSNSPDPLFISYGYEEGFIGISCNLSAIEQDKNGTVWIGTNDRLTAFFGDIKTEIPPPNLQITSVRVFNENIPWTDLAINPDSSVILSNGLKIGRFRFDSLSRWYNIPIGLILNHDQNYISFSFTAISHNHIKKMRFQYMLQGLDEGWNTLTDINEVTYGSLKPGRYKFRVKAVNSSGLWSETVEYQFQIKHPWWNTLWFYVSVSLLFILTALNFIRNREQRLKREKEILQEKVAEKTRELSMKNEQLEINNLEKDKFFSIIAHDLKGPFSGFLGLTQIMAEEAEQLSSEEVKEIATNMRSSANGLYALLENLLQWSRMKQSSIQFSPSKLDLYETISENLSTITLAAKNKNIELIFDIPESVYIFADKNMIQTIIRNIIANAVKFTPSGGYVKVSAKRDSEDFIEITVEDNGIGMSTDMVNNLFKLNMSKNREGTNGEPSSGLGLLICKEFVEKHEGNIWVISKEGVGSTFHITMPTNDIKVIN